MYKLNGIFTKFGDESLFKTNPSKSSVFAELNLKMSKISTDINELQLSGTENNSETQKFDVAPIYCYYFEIIIL